MGMRYADLDPVLGELQKDGLITRLPSPKGKEMISLRNGSQNKPGRGLGEKLVAVLGISLSF
jgi:hypothetical protein